MPPSLAKKNAAIPETKRKEQLRPVLSARNIVQRGQNHRVRQSISSVTDSAGHVISRTNSVTELKGGLHYAGARGEWLESDTTIQVQNNGTAIANHAPHKVVFGPNINRQGVITLTTPDHKTLRSHILGIALYDFKKKESVLIAEPKDSIGKVKGNQVTYSDAFEGIQADVRYTFTTDGLEQDVIFRSRLPDGSMPEAFNFDPRTTWLEVWTEFPDAPKPQIDQRIRKGWKKSTVDKSISFGSMVIGPGTAFGLNQRDGKLNGLEVLKHWMTVEGRNFLCEEIPFRLCAPHFRRLPAAHAALPKPNAGIIGKVAKTRVLPEQKVAQAQPDEKIQVALSGGGSSAQVAQNTPLDAPGFVLDWSIVAATGNDFIFAGDTTYLIEGPVALTGVTTIEPGAVIKFEPSVNAKITILGSITCPNESYAPAVLTASTDDSIGEIIDTGPPDGIYAEACLILNNGGQLKNLRFKHAGVGVLSYGDYSVKHCQFIHCDKAMHTEQATFYAGNILLNDVTTGFYGKYFEGTVEHLTFDQGARVALDYQYDEGSCSAPPSSQLTLRNSLITGVADWGTTSFSQDHVETLTSNAGVYQNAAHYLAPNSPYRGVGNINASLLDDFKKRTTHPPIDFPQGMELTGELTLFPQVPRYVSGAPDLGYYYSVLDFTVSAMLVKGGQITVKPGTVIGFRKDDWRGFDLWEGSQFMARGTAEKPIIFTSVSFVREETLSAGGVVGVVAFIPDFIWNPDGLPPPTLDFRFCNFFADDWDSHLWSGASWDWSAYTSYDSSMNWVVQDCQFHGGWIVVGTPIPDLQGEEFDPGSISWVNTLFDRVQIVLDPTYYGDSRIEYNLVRKTIENIGFLTKQWSPSCCLGSTMPGATMTS